MLEFVIVYSKNKIDFLSDVNTGRIADIVTGSLTHALAYRPTISEQNSYRRSLPKIAAVLNDPSIPTNLKVHVEYSFPMTPSRADVVFTGKNKDGKYVIIIVELKQWSKIEASGLEDVVKVKIQGIVQDKAHPAWTYMTLLRDLNKEARSKNVLILPCVYLHNYVADGIIDADQYETYTSKVRTFYKDEEGSLGDFIKESIHQGDDVDILRKIDNGEKNPSKELRTAFSRAEKVLPLLDEQKVAFELAKSTAAQASPANKITCILEGRAGTGKTILAVYLMAALIHKLHKMTLYTTKNATLRDNLKNDLELNARLTAYSRYIVSSSRFLTARENEFPAVIVDEAHRLTMLSDVKNHETGKWEKKGENQIKEIIKASQFNIFFLDEDQIVSLDDIGRRQEIEKQAKLLGSKVVQLPTLPSQFRSNGSNAYIEWLDNTLQIRQTNTKILGGTFKVEVTPTAASLREMIVKNNAIDGRSRMLGSYCDDWVSRNSSHKFDMHYDNGKCELKYNQVKDDHAWIRNSDAVYDMGIIHKCQGLDLSYAGVFIGPDLIVRKGIVETHPENRSIEDNTIKNYRSYDRLLVDRIIKNTYKVLLTRAHSGCYIYSEDFETREYFKRLTGQQIIS